MSSLAEVTAAFEGHKAEFGEEEMTHPLGGELAWSCGSAGKAAPSREWLRLARRAQLLAWASLGWLTIEGTVGMIAGLIAGSIALVGFGLDSAIDGLASVIVVWRFTGSRTRSEHSERRAQQLVAVSFFLLAPYVAIESVHTLLVEQRAETSVVGVARIGGRRACSACASASHHRPPIWLPVWTNRRH